MKSLAISLFISMTVLLPMTLKAQPITHHHDGKSHKHTLPKDRNHSHGGGPISYISTSAGAPNGFMKDQNGCFHAVPYAGKETSVTWTGGCKNGYADGAGIYTSKRTFGDKVTFSLAPISDQSIYTFNGIKSKGYKIKGKSTHPTNSFNGEYKNGKVYKGTYLNKTNGAISKGTWKNDDINKFYNGILTLSGGNTFKVVNGDY